MAAMTLSGNELIKRIKPTLSNLGVTDASIVMNIGQPAILIVSYVVTDEVMAVIGSEFGHDNNKKE